MAEEEREGDSRDGQEIIDRGPFGPGFFAGQLKAFARECCPDPAEMLPAVELHLATGEVLDLCHVMGFAPAFLALAVRDRGARTEGGSNMRTELVPYALITRITIRPIRAEGAHVGFNADHAPCLVPAPASPEATLRAVAQGADAMRRRGGSDDPT